MNMIIVRRIPEALQVYMYLQYSHCRIYCNGDIESAQFNLEPKVANLT
jgi:hypothetical protein